MNDLDTETVDSIIVSIPVANNGKHFDFFEPEELSNFIKNERMAWDWVYSNRVNIGNQKNIRSLIKNNLCEATFKILDELLVSWNKGGDSLENQARQTERLLTNFSFPFSETIIGKHILEASTSNELIACLILLLRSGAAIPDNIKNGNVYVSSLNIFQIEINKANRLLYSYETLSDRATIDSNISYLDENVGKIEDYVSKAKEITKNLEIFHKSTESIHHKWSSKLRKTLAKRIILLRRKDKSFRDRQSDLALEAHNSALETTNTAKDVYLSQIELDSSVSYWNEKKDNHKSASKTWLKTLVIMSLAIFSIPLLTLSFLPNFNIPVENLIFGVINPVAISISVLSISIFSYGIRFCSKQYSSHQHLFLEATERCTLLKTYLALMNENKLSESEDRKLALECLFRSAQTGIVQDLGSVLPSDTIIKVIEKQVKS